MPTSNSANSPSVITIDRDNISHALKGVPRKVAMAMKAITMMRYGSLEITMPGGKTVAYDAPEPGPHGVAVLHNWGIARRALSAGSLGVAESYLDGEWDSPDVTSFLELFLLNAYGNGADRFFDRNIFVNMVTRVSHWLNRNTKSGSKRNIAAHYDLGNAFYTQWLDPSMTYSSALFSDGANSLEEAQEAKYRALAEATDIRPEHHVLEIGCGWGGFAEYVAGKIGAKVTCLTISKEQFDFATERMKKAGLDDKVTIKFQDYREETGIYDRIGSIEMFEAVGQKFWPSYFSQLKNCLKPEGRAGIQYISILESDFDHYRSKPDFIQKYIFPGGMLPTPKIMQDMGAEQNLAIVADRAFGPDYGSTLKEWRIRFNEAWPNIVPLGFDERFRRMWNFYLHYCEAGFRFGSINVHQTVFQKGQCAETD